MGEGGSNRVVPKATETQRRLKELQEQAPYLVERSRSRWQRETLEQIDILLFKQSLAKWLSFSKRCAERIEEWLRIYK